ncbi:MAG: hypothetical protein AAF662_12415 [Pseudomonadota bacterium]
MNTVIVFDPTSQQASAILTEDPAQISTVAKQTTDVDGKEIKK